MYVETMYGLLKVSMKQRDSLFGHTVRAKHTTLGTRELRSSGSSPRPPRGCCGESPAPRALGSQMCSHACPSTGALSKIGPHTCTRTLEQTDHKHYIIMCSLLMLQQQLEAHKEYTYVNQM